MAKYGDGSIKPHGDGWELRWTDNGTRRTKVVKGLTERQARAHLRELQVNGMCTGASDGGLLRRSLRALRGLARRTFRFHLGQHRRDPLIVRDSSPVLRERRQDGRAHDPARERQPDRGHDQPADDVPDPVRTIHGVERSGWCHVISAPTDPLYQRNARTVRRRVNPDLRAGRRIAWSGSSRRTSPSRAECTQRSSSGWTAPSPFRRTARGSDTLKPCRARR